MSGWLRRLFAARPTATPQQARQMQAGGAVLLDVREDTEWRAGHAPGARHIPLSRLPARIKDLPPRRPVVTVCRSGARSARAAEGGQTARAICGPQGQLGQPFSVDGTAVTWQEMCDGEVAEARCGLLGRISVYRLRCDPGPPLGGQDRVA
jgi:rhodanese-related sulfurtransferase